MRPPGPRCPLPWPTLPCITRRPLKGPRRPRQGMPKPSPDILKAKEKDIPKMKTTRSTKKRFKPTGRVKDKIFPSQRRHRQISRPKKMKRHARGPQVMNESDAKVVKKYFLPNG